MSAIIRDDHDVLLDYGDVGQLHDFHRRTQPNAASDRERMVLLSAERELLTLRIIIDHIIDDADFGGDALDRIYRSLNTIQRGLEMARSRMGMAVTPI